MKFIRIMFQMLIGILLSKFKYASDVPVMAGWNLALFKLGKIGESWNANTELIN